MALGMIAMEQTKATEMTMAQSSQLLDYLLAYHVDAKIRFYASEMILNIHSDAFYLAEGHPHDQTCGHIFMGWLPKDGEPIRINGAFHMSTNVIRFDVASTADAELGVLFHNCHMGMIFDLKDMGHVQPKTLVHCDNATVVGITNITKWQFS
jgi:hypothetical protein